jgi:SAM-dependent methyltransferase
VIVSLDYLEHVHDDHAALDELRRVLKPGGSLLISTPTTGPSFVLNKVKPLIGLTLDKYGHVREGYDLQDLTARLRQQGYEIVAATTYSRFFTELIEMGIICFRFLLGKGWKENQENRTAISRSVPRKVLKSIRINEALFHTYRSALFTAGLLLAPLSGIRC